MSYDDIFQWLKNYRLYSENTKINALNEIFEQSSKSKRQIWLSEILKDYDKAKKARLLKRIFYNVILKGFNRKIINTRYANDDIAVPNISTLLLATSSKCNLECLGCESADERNDGEASYEQLDYIVKQAKMLNIFHIVITGKGEPLYDESQKKKLFKIMKSHWDLNYILFTNCLTLGDKDIIEIAKLENLITIVSIDGLKEYNDRRRGRGVFNTIIEKLKIMKQHKLLYGFSATVYKDNYRNILSDEFLNMMIDMGCKIGFYLMYTPLSVEYEGDMMLNEYEIKEYKALYKAVKDSTIIPILDPEIFEQEHGCRAKRGSVIYIDGTTGKVMPCVKTPYSPEECNIYLNQNKNRLLEILKSNYFVNYRNSYSKCSQCSHDFKNQLNQYLLVPDISLGDKERIEKQLVSIENGLIP
jgi:MoaA/NifB/PqqE/SkfB family radical SAM enzyme